MKYSIEGLRKFAHANANETWYLQFRKFYRKHGLAHAWRFFKGHPIIAQMQDISGYYQGKSGPCLTRPECWILMNYKVHNLCTHCGEGRTKVLSDASGYAAFCSIKCSSAAEATIAKRAETSLKKYGVSNPGQAEVIKNKRIETFRDRFGCDNPFQNEKVKSKIKKTLTKRLGVSNPSKSSEVKAKKRETFRKNYGHDHWTQNKEVYEESGLKFNKISIAKGRVTYLDKTGYANPAQNPEVQAKMKATCYEKYGVTNPSKSPLVQARIVEAFMKKYGVANAFQSEEVKAKIRKTCRERYGVEHPTLLRGAFGQALKPVVDKQGVLHWVQGYEDLVVTGLSRLEKTKKIVTSRSKIPTIRYIKDVGTEHRYHPDILVETSKGISIIEVKSIYTLLAEWRMNIKKFRAAKEFCEERGFNFYVVVKYRGRFVFVREPRFKKDFTDAGVKLPPVGHRQA